MIIGTEISNYSRDDAYICSFIKYTESFWNPDFMHWDKGGYVCYTKEIPNNRSLHIIEVHFSLSYLEWSVQVRRVVLLHWIMFLPRCFPSSSSWLKLPVLPPMEEPTWRAVSFPLNKWRSTQHSAHMLLVRIQSHDHIQWQGRLDT